MNITISGLSGAGTTTIGKLLAKKQGMAFVSTGELFRKHAESRGMSLTEFRKVCEKDPEIDRMLDLRQEELSETMDNTVFEGRITGFKCNAGIKVWVFAPENIRSERIAKREGSKIDVVLEKMRLRDFYDSKRYKKYYDIDVTDTSVYDVIIDSSKGTPEDAVRQIVEKFKNK
ncbi:MAG: AAA family ATPase [Candidatus Aenigmarchaeota archaeon]|nr:AAA family ATPase [Candidatus Aenigmarchaeota archaeon]